MTDEAQRAAIERLVDAERLWAVALGNDTEPLIRAACDALVVGSDGPHLMTLAAQDFGPTEWGFADIVRGVLMELGRAYHEPDSPEAQIDALGAMARRVVSGGVPPREFAEWAHRTIGHDGAPIAETLVVLDDVYDEYHGAPADDVDQQVLVQARALANL